MFTVCPSCTRQFRIYAEHIAAASGQVRCGFCHEQFNALDRLYDEPLTNEKILKEFQLADNLVEESDPEPVFEIPDMEETESSPEVVISKTNTDIEQELITAIDEIGIEQTDSKQVAYNQEQEADVELKVEEPVIKNNESKQKRYEFPEPDELLEDIPVRQSRIVTFLWSSACFIGLITIFGQVAWFNRDRVLLEYPQFRPYVKQLCQELDCNVIRQRDASAIKLINRDVRLHPAYEDTLLVNATMKNELSIRQPYPRVQLTLFDTTGSILGYRNFLPTDYLDNSIDIDEGMPVSSPVHFVLEVSGPTSGAVSFEFRFL